ncbi:MAG: aminomethyltransferase family protein [Coriobacteriaceae bacterium]|nr:aminomethyltransferase family protein [Coriobacteriaceae bacterium]
MNKNLYKFDEFKRTQHMAVRNTVGWYEFTHMVTKVSGPDAAAVLDKVYTNSIANLAVGRERYSLQVNEKGEIVDDVIIMRLEENLFWVSNINVNQAMGAIGEASDGFEIDYDAISFDNKMYAIQGPKSLELVNAIAAEPVDDLKFFSFINSTIDGIPVIINRAGFTGEKFGYEIYVATPDAPKVLDKIREAGAALGGEEVTEYALMCWTLPLEKGLLLIRDIKWMTPYEADMMRFVDMNKDFIGKKALKRMAKKTPKMELVGFKIDRDDAFIPSKHLGSSGAPVFLGDEYIGRVAKFVYSFVLEQDIGLLYVERDRVKPGDHVTIRHNDAYDVEVCERTFI